MSDLTFFGELMLLSQTAALNSDKMVAAVPLLTRSVLFHHRAVNKQRHDETGNNEQPCCLLHITAEKSMLFYVLEDLKLKCIVFQIK